MTSADQNAFPSVKQANSALAGCLVLLLLLRNSCLAIIQIYRLLAFRLPSTRWEEAIFLSATRFPTIAQIYSVSNLQHPPYWISVYSPLYYAVVRTVTSDELKQC
jgi:hypothetical protein